jgi:hypothetical protein
MRHFYSKLVHYSCSSTLDQNHQNVTHVSTPYVAMDLAWKFKNQNSIADDQRSTRVCNFKIYFEMAHARLTNGNRNELPVDL